MSRPKLLLNLAGKIFVLLVIIFFLPACKEKDTVETVDPNAFMLNGKAFKLNEFSAASSLNQTVILARGGNFEVTLALFKADTGVFTIVAGNPLMKKGEATATLVYNKQMFYGQSGTARIHKQSDNSYDGELYFNSLSAANGYIEVRNVRFNKVVPVLVSYGTVSDFEGNEYKTVKIGRQTWMAENLRSLKYANGENISNVRNFNEVDTLAKVYGRLYTYGAAMHGNPVEMTQGVCPNGWHIPTLAETDTLIANAGGPAIAAKNLRASVLWADGMVSTNNTGFTAVPSGNYYAAEGYYNLLGYSSAYWLSHASPDAGYLIISTYTFSFTLPPAYHYFSVRCIKTN